MKRKIQEEEDMSYVDEVMKLVIEKNPGTAGISSGSAGSAGIATDSN